MATQYEKGRREVSIRLLDALIEVLPVVTDKDLAGWIGVKPESISQWRSGTVAPHRAALKKIAQSRELAYRAGWEDAVRLYAIWSGGEQFVGVQRKTLGQALEDGPDSDVMAARLEKDK